MKPDRASLLAPLLRLRTHLPVSEIIDGQKPLPNHVYVPPAWAQVRLEAGQFRLSRVSTLSERNRRIDVFLESMARELGAQCVGVVLSGGGADGSRGLLSVAAAGGMTIAQSPATALRDRMPLSAFSTGCIQHVLDPSHMPAAILRHFSAVGPEQTGLSVEAPVS
jgi:two-component system CheB/CheR fusion protein